MAGRAIQDLWIVPTRAARDRFALAAGPYGTTIRYYVPSEERWHIAWVNPVRNSVSMMTARLVDGEIVQEGLDDEGRAFRWVFFAIQRDRFRWRAEESIDGKSWRLLQEMIVTRRH